MNRRHAIKLLGAATSAGLSGCRREKNLLQFHDFAFGTDVHFQLHGVSEAVFKKLSSTCSQRLRELESIFSLYQPESAISRLNQNGELEDAPAELVRLIRHALDLGEQTKGIFDITVQPLWNWRENWKQADLPTRKRMETTSWQKSLELVDYRKVSVTDKRVAFEKEGMAITLNGIAQGYATDRIRDLLLKSGINHALVNIGEYASIGNAPDGTPWQVALAANAEMISIPSGRALAASSGSGYTFDPEGRYHHIFRPSDGTNTRPEKNLIVTAPSATLADALATTFTVANASERNEILIKFPEATFREIG